MAHIFISHSSADGALADELLDWLHGQGFTSTFLDFDAAHGIAAGADWERTLYRELNAADAVILLLTSHWMASKWCFVEFAQARSQGKFIFPLVYSEIPGGRLSPDLQHLDMEKDRVGSLARLAAELTRIAAQTQGGFDWDRQRPPYPGLLSFSGEDAAIYFGRDEEIRQLMERLNARYAQGGEKLVVVLGASGSGKSSLVRAGVLPRLARVGAGWMIVPPFRPGHMPLDELASALATAMGQAPAWRQVRAALLEPDATTTLSDLARDLRAAAARPAAQVLITIDQAEELYAAGERTQQTASFFRALNAMLDERLPYLVLMTLRSDFLAHLQQEPELTVRFEQFGLPQMLTERISDIILGPARVAGLQVEPAFVEAVRADAHGNDVLPLLAFALRELYDQNRASGQLTAAAYRALGDPANGLLPLENAVRRKADQVLNELNLSEDDMIALKEAFVPMLVRVNHEGEYVRRTAAMDELPERARPLIERLAQARLLTLRGDASGVQVEVAHEALLRKWPRLRHWLDEEREFLLGKEQLERDLAEWQQALPERKADALLSGLKLARAHEWLTGRPRQLTMPEREFIGLSQRAHAAAMAARERARRRVLYGAVGAALVLAVAMGVALWQIWTVDSLRLASEAIEHVHQDLGLAMHEAVQAASRSHTREAETALNAVLSAGATERFVTHHGVAVSATAFAPDGLSFATGTQDGVVRLWDALSGKLRATMRAHHGSVAALAYAPDGASLASAGVDGAIDLFETATGRVLWNQAAHPGTVLVLAFSPDGRQLTSAGEDGLVRIWDAASGSPGGAEFNTGTPVKAATISPDGQVLAALDSAQTLHLWQLGQPRQKPVAIAVQGASGALGFSPNGALLLVGQSDGDMQWISTATCELLGARTFHAHTDVVYANSFSRDGRQILTASRDRTVKVWNADTGALLATLTGHADGVRAATFSADGQRILSASTDGTSRLWETGDAHLERTLAAAHGAHLLALLPQSGDTIRVLTGEASGAANIVDGDGHILATLSPGGGGPIKAAAFSQDGAGVVTVDSGGSPQLWDARTGQRVGASFGPDDEPSVLSISGDGRYIAVAGAVAGGHVWRSADHGLAATLSGGHLAAINSIAFSTDGKYLATAGDDFKVVIWELAQPQKPAVVLSGRHSGAVFDARFSRDGTMLVTASQDHTARVWDTHSGTLLHTLAGHTGNVTSAEFSPDGSRIVTASDDGSVRLWDAVSGRQLAAIAVPKSGSPLARFSPDGGSIFASIAGGRVAVLRVDFADLLARAREHLPVDVSP